MDKHRDATHSRRHGARARGHTVKREAKTVLTFEARAKVYCWSVDRGVRPVIKH